MTKAELCARVAEQTELTKKETEDVVNAVLDTIMETLAAGERVQLVGFGCFEVRERAARRARNWTNGSTVELPPTKAVQFRAGKNLREIVK
jgi:DNA-binding protein HU-beta